MWHHCQLTLKVGSTKSWAGSQTQSKEKMEKIKIKNFNLILAEFITMLNKCEHLRKTMQNKTSTFVLWKSKIGFQKKPKNPLKTKHQIAHPPFSEIVQMRESNHCYSHRNGSATPRADESQACFRVNYLRSAFSRTFWKGKIMSMIASSHVLRK